MTENCTLGKWATKGVPHKGWTCVGVQDFEEPSFICEMCETMEIRYAHEMVHPDYDGPLFVGCICAGHGRRRQARRVRATGTRKVIGMSKRPPEFRNHRRFNAPQTPERKREMTKREDDYFGLCPHCYTGFVKAGRTDVMYCKEHRVSWILGAGHFSSPCETEEEEERIYEETIGGFERIEPAFWPRDWKWKLREKLRDWKWKLNRFLNRKIDRLIVDDDIPF
jgi:hypothetical protein